MIFFKLQVLESDYYKVSVGCKTNVLLNTHGI